MSREGPRAPTAKICPTPRMMPCVTWVRRVELGEEFTLQQEPRQMAHGDDLTLALAVKTTAVP